ncbi:DNA-binding GntR family transcriptional regulator [Sphingomonas sp. BE138]|uniref:GntR family transcriptional regulator n=1 Tax=Sphingomonas sp. BE138 TaxID=2817845 RepID=UPI0028652261|nr:GntR family transcriptional regulator [Sphingomonas sp. BE138]MDR6786905.1 DNA-binding GntR family transcriptional regulator [Sphingomonas sp. BE138]
MTGIIVRNLSEQLVDLVRERILAGQVEGDRAIRQDALAAELGVSKIPLREALTRLEQEGLVRSRANRGYFVRELTIAEAEEVYALRLKLEPEIAAQAAGRASEEERAVAVRTLAQLDEVTHAHGDGVGAFNRAFHLALLRPSHQPITTTMLERLHVLGERYVRKHLEPLGRDQRANDEHAELLDRWLARDTAGVRERMHAHIEQTVLDLRREFEMLDRAAG